LPGHKGTFGHLAIVAGSFGITARRCWRPAPAQRAQPDSSRCSRKANVYFARSGAVAIRQCEIVDDGLYRLLESASAVLTAPAWPHWKRRQNEGTTPIHPVLARIAIGEAHMVM